MNNAGNSGPWKNNLFSRRQFLGSCLAGSASLLLFKPNLRAASGQISLTSAEPGSRPRIRLVFSHIPPDRPTWPNIGYDYESRKKELLSRLKQALPEIDFFPVTVQSQKEAETLLQQDQDIDGYVIYLLGIWTGAARTIIAAGRPVILVDDLYAGSGEFLIEYAAARRAGHRVAGVTSSRFEDAVKTIGCFTAIKKMKQSRILDVTDSPGFWGNPQKIKQYFGTEVVKIGSAEINEAYRKASRALGDKWARTWISRAERVVEPSEEEIKKSGQMYIALLDLMKAHKTQAITVDCLSLFYTGKLPAYPCLGFCQLNDDGLVGACEGDLPSTTMMLLAGYLVGRPGYISDPVIDTSQNKIIYAHCVAPTRVFGPKGPANPFRIRNHSEDRQGAAIQSLLPTGEIVTSFELNSETGEIVLHQALTTGNVEEDKACRTKLAAEPMGNINKLLGEWDRFGWHRVTVYGDLKRKLEVVSHLLGLKVVEEA
ncbi:MAG: hypothetical protein ACUVRL_08885 [Candidatus Saccharicenans sp.]|uniref:hypothetical protein n=1 Tax=Candidatus Saccharicenans sp. TaxID=2819258 RepID=UPI00404B83F2